MRKPLSKRQYRPGGGGTSRRAEMWLTWLNRLSVTLKLTGIAAAVCIVSAVVLLLYLRTQALPATVISQTSELLDLNGEVIDTFHTGQNRRPVRLGDISPHLIEATISVEDRRFYDHTGFDIKGMARAVVANVESRSKKQGASTLTQQLARNLYLTHEKTWTRKLREAMYTAQLEMKYAKDEILEMYLNQIYYGHGAYGIEAASRMYFDKSSSDLTLAESAMLAGIPKGPSYYSPYRNMKNAKDRQQVILNTMAELGRITPEQAKAAYEELLPLQAPGSSETEGLAPYFRDYVQTIATQELGLDEQLLHEGGIRIYTTIDKATQQAAEQALTSGLPADSELQGALVAIDPRNGYVKAMVGGRDYSENQFNRVFATTRQPGSSFKPLLYLTALQSRKLTPISTFRSEPTVFTYDEGRQTYQPRNHNDKYFNEAISMRQAIASSDNIFAVNTVMSVGPEEVIATARRLGIESPMKPVPSLALGAFPVSPFEMASAFSVLAGGGVRHTPTAILRIESRSGEVLYEAKPEAETVIDPAAAYVMTSLLESVFEPGGTANRVSALIKRPVAGKTGTTNTDAWLVGYTPELTTAVWVGYDKGRSINTSEAHSAAPIFATFMEQALAAVPPKIFPMPAGVVSVYVDPDSGLLAGSGCAEKRLETFIAGTQPIEVACGEADEQAEEHDNSGTIDAEVHKRQSWWQQLKRWWD
ncbi:transglycosylase domain-containing protein [Paenibacillus sp. 1P07SE]|uniref:transglycosylase domain-containing protein n=1 Tax=Paenibacillus sp. 1P07SE TaxID=3132209 RepID=UPI0039A46306